jgi:hypothetical protein
MHTVEEAYRLASELYWIAFLLTGHEELSLRVTTNALSSETILACTSSPQLGARRRGTVIRDALAATQAEIATSVQQFAAQQPDLGFITTTGRSADSGLSKAQIEEALLAVDLFPRCALLLTVFEGLPLEEAGALLRCDRDLMKAGRMSALRDLTRNLVSITCIPPAAQEIETWRCDADHSEE